MKRCFETRWSGTPDRPRRNSERSDGGSEAALRRRPITTESIGSAATHPSLRGALATKQSRGHNMRGASNPDGRTAAPRLLRFARNDGQGIGSLVSACRLTKHNLTLLNVTSAALARKISRVAPRRFEFRSKLSLTATKFREIDAHFRLSHQPTSFERGLS